MVPSQTRPESNVRGDVGEVVHYLPNGKKPDDHFKKTDEQCEISGTFCDEYHADRPELASQVRAQKMSTGRITHSKSPVDVTGSSIFIDSGDFEQENSY